MRVELRNSWRDGKRAMARSIAREHEERLEKFKDPYPSRARRFGKEIAKFKVLTSSSVVRCRGRPARGRCYGATRASLDAARSSAACAEASVSKYGE